MARKNIHDENFKHNFNDIRVAHDFLKYNLPKKVLEHVDIDTVQIEPTELIPSRYRSKRNADIVYSVKNKRDEKVYALLHLEAQSTHVKEMALRVWEYHVAITRAHLKTGAEKIPLILTFVLYHGSEEWTSAKSIAELFEDFELYMDVSLRAPFLINLTKAETEELKQQEAAAAPQMIMKNQALGDFCGVLKELWPLLEEYEQDDEQNIDYMVTLDQHGGSQFLEELSKFDQKKATNYKIMFELAIQKAVQKEHKKALKLGIIKGKKEGINKGKQEGKREEKKAIAMQMLAEGMIKELIAKITGLSVEEIKALSHDS